MLRIIHYDSYYSWFERHECFEQFLILNCFDHSFFTPNLMITQLSWIKPKHFNSKRNCFTWPSFIVATTIDQQQLDISVWADWLLESPILCYLTTNQVFLAMLPCLLHKGSNIWHRMISTSIYYYKSLLLLIVTYCCAIQWLVLIIAYICDYVSTSS